MRERLLFAAWLAWTAVVVPRCCVQLFRAIETPPLPSLADRAGAAIPVVLVAAAALSGGAVMLRLISVK